LEGNAPATEGDGEGVRFAMMSSANPCCRTGSSDGDKFLSTRHKCIESEGDGEQEASGEHSEEEGMSLNVLLRMREGSSSSDTIAKS